MYCYGNEIWGSQGNDSEYSIWYMMVHSLVEIYLWEETQCKMVSKTVINF